MTRVAAISANLGAYDRQIEWAGQRVPAGMTVDVHRFTDATLPPRAKAMTPALQCGIPKWFGWDLVPGADLYLWVDASCALLRADSVAWFVDQLGDAELLLFKHPDRQTVRAEYEFITARLARAGEKYLTRRYQGEHLDAQFAAITADTEFVDDRLFASTAFMYRPTPRVRALLKEVWFGKTRWHLHDQLYLAYAVAKSGCTVQVLDENYTKCPYLTYVRNRKR